MCIIRDSNRAVCFSFIHSLVKYKLKCYLSSILTNRILYTDTPLTTLGMNYIPSLSVASLYETKVATLEVDSIVPTWNYLAIVIRIVVVSPWTFAFTVALKRMLWKNPYLDLASVTGNFYDNVVAFIVTKL